MLDEEHDTLPCEAHDTNIYTCGSIGDHNVVVACLPSGQTGTGSAATAASLMRSSFTYIRFGLMVGIGGGVPSEDADIRLGDVVVSSPHATHGGVVQYDFGKATPSGFERTGSLNAPPTILLSAVSILQARYMRRRGTLQDHLSRLEILAGFGRIKAGPDALFNSTYDHVGGRTCDECDNTYIVHRQVREQEIVVHYGTIASGNQVMRSARERQRRWQPYAAGTAAAYTKELLLVIPAADVTKTRRAEDAMNSANKRSLQSPSPNRGISKRRKPSILDYKKIVPAGTCKWLLENDRYCQWNDAHMFKEHHGFMWIKGKAGTGKSTLMKFALANARKMMINRITLSFFFNARGQDLEKSTAGTYRSLLLQLLSSLPALQGVFDSLAPPTAKISENHPWTVDSLQTLLETAILSLGDSSVIRGMIHFLERVGGLAHSRGVHFQVCFSSRHYPFITIRNGLELVLERQEEHSQDITNYIEAELHIGKSKIAQQVRAELQEKASGVFMWVVLVVNILNKESDRGQIHKLRQKVREIPGDLNDLIRDILTRDTHNKDELILSIQFILFARQPLSPEQLYYAILSGIEPDAVTARDPEEFTEEVIQRFILNSCKGLAEATVSTNRSIQFIHESIRDFLLKENGLGEIWPEYGDNFQGQSHERLKQCCLNQLRVDIATPLKIPNDLPEASSQPAAYLRESATQAFPFLEYAVHNVLYHADKAAQCGGISQTDFLENFPLLRWVKLDNLFMRDQSCRRTGQGGEYSNALQAALREGYQEIAIILLRKGANVNAQCGEYSNALQAASAGGYEEVVRLLTENATDIDAQSRSYSDALFLASAEGHNEVVKLLLEKGAKAGDYDGYSGDALQVALAGGHQETVILLLEKGANVNVNAQGGYYGNALQAASKYYKNKKCGHYGNALQAALAGLHKETFILLLEKGADINAQGGYYGNALQAAIACLGSKKFVEFLLEKGADINAQGGEYGNALQAASYCGKEEIVVLLLEKGAHVNAQGGLYGNALQAALHWDYTDIVTLLESWGATRVPWVENHHYNSIE
ncbi:ankyrin repeat domain-containing protein [Boeremia exigua]|uniref:ankyrin repeat domain-containing protein n=1 Tax=Boeremia exigua TaxID=749465 RepID=UPI001E8CB02D|nr:ankyrin repeat domain-containing protein [Boeremia exigua]KAH6637880.1 ankyrin repeat domain-containing protein [Boeremia exigua]